MVQTQTVIHPSVLTGRNALFLIDDLCRELALAADKNNVDIHRIRVDIKRLRAWIKLLEVRTTDSELKYVDQCLRNISKQFSFSRDTEIIPETLDWLQGKTGKPDQSAALQKISRYMQYPEFDSMSHDNLTGINRDIFSGLKQRSVKVDLEHIINNGLKKTNKKMMHYGKRAFASRGTLKDLHKFRQWVKYLCYQIEFIQASCPTYCQDECRLLDKLGKRLGRIHDLDVLRQNIKKLKHIEECKQAVVITGRLIDKNIRKLTRRSRKQFREFSKCSTDNLLYSIS